MSTSEKLERLSTEEPEQPRVAAVVVVVKLRMQKTRPQAKQLLLQLLVPLTREASAELTAATLLPLVKERPQPRTALLVRRPGMWVLRKRQP